MKNDEETILKAKISYLLNQYIQEGNDKKKALIASNQPLPPDLIHSDVELANTIGTRPASISDILNGKSLIKLTTLIKCLIAFKVALSDFFGQYESLSEDIAINYLRERREKMQKES